MFDRGTTYAGDTGLGGEYVIHVLEDYGAGLAVVEDINGKKMVRWFRGSANCIDQLETMENDFSELHFNGLAASIITSGGHIHPEWLHQSPYVGTGVHAVERGWHIENGVVSTVHQTDDNSRRLPATVKFTDFQGELEFIASDLTPLGLCAILDSRCTAEDRDTIIDEVINMGAWA